MKLPHPPIDQVISFETPEGIDLDLDVAGPVVRALAWLVDQCYRLIGYVVLSIVLSVMGDLGQGAMLLAVFLVEWWYPVLFEVSTGTTPGKKQFGLMVCCDNGTPVSWSASILRNLLRVADFLPLFYGLGLAVMMCNKEFKRLGDLIGGTLVIYRTEATREPEIGDAESIVPPQPLKPAEQRAILDFVERSHSLSNARTEELADLLSGITGAKGQEGVKRVRGLANWMKKGAG